MIRRSIAFNTLVSSGARVVGSALAFISFAFIARALGKGGFGEYSIAMAFGYTASALADLGLYAVLIREISKTGVDEKRITSHIFFLRVLILVTVSLFTFVVAWFLPNYSQMVKLAIGLGIIAFSFSSLSQLLIAIFQKYFSLEKVAIAEVVGRSAQLLFVYIAFVSGLGLYYFLGAAIVGAFFIFFVEYVFSRKLIPFGLEFDTRYTKELFITAFPIGVALVFTLIYFRVDTILLSLMKPAEAVGVYNVAYKVLEFAIFFPAVFAGIVMPLLSKYAVSQKEKFKDTFQKAFDVIVIFATPILFGGFILAPHIVRLAGGEEFSASAVPLRWLLFAVWFIFLGNLLGRAIIALDEQKKAAWIYFGGMIFNIIANLIVIPRYSYNGAAATTVFTELVITGLLFFLIVRKTSYFPRVGILFKSFILSSFMAVFVYLFRSQPILFILPSAILLYLGSIYIFNIIDKENLKFLFRGQGD